MEISSSARALTPHPDTPSLEAAQARITRFMGHAYDMVEQLERQNAVDPHFHPELQSKISLIYAKAIGNLGEIEDKMSAHIKGESHSSLTGKDIKSLAKLLKRAEKDIAKILQKAQIEVAAEVGSNGEAALKEKIEMLARGGFKAKLVQFLAKGFKTHRRALEGFKFAQISLNQASKRALPSLQEGQEESEVQMDRRAEFEKFTKGDNLKRRAGVIGINGVYRIQLTFSDKGLHKQLKAFTAQNISHKEERVALTQTIEVPLDEDKKLSVKSHLVPLNKEFDKKLNILQDTQAGSVARVFEKIFGAKGGISSMNRQDPHLINGWESSLQNQEGEIIYRALRHAITSDKYEVNKAIRKANSQKAAAELLKAALLQEIADRGLTLEEASKQGIPLNFNSVSLVTPDDLRAIGSKGANEKHMLLDQIEALHHFEGERDFEIEGVRIPLHLRVNTFNFGVNAGVVDWELGTLNQYEYNLKALKGLQQQVDALKSVLPEGREKDNVNALMADISSLMKDRKAYLSGDNQYEVGAKIINLTNLMDQIVHEQKKAGNASLEKMGFKCAFNCMSGKDRTGIMDGIAKAFATMASINHGRYPTQEELKSDEKVRAQFRDIVIPILLQAGGLEVTRTNTGAVGYKVTKHALIGGLSEKHFLDLVGLSKTTSS